MAKKSQFVSALDRIRNLPEDRRARIEAGAAKIIEEMHLAEIRKALKMPQTLLADTTGMKQAEISRIENNPESVQLKTMERYVNGLGGVLKIVALFPDGTEATIPLRQGKLVKSRVSIAETPLLKPRKEARRPPLRTRTG